MSKYYKFFISMPMHGIKDEVVKAFFDAYKELVWDGVEKGAFGKVIPNGTLASRAIILDMIDHEPEFKKLNWEIVSPVKDGLEDNGITTFRIRNLALSIATMALADVVVFAPGWERTNGCVVEKMVCDKYGIASYIIEPETFAFKLARS